MSYRLRTTPQNPGLADLAALPGRPCRIGCRPGLPPPPAPVPPPAPAPGTDPSSQPPPVILPAPPPPPPPPSLLPIKPRLFVQPRPPRWIPGGVLNGDAAPAPRITRPGIAPRLPVLNLPGTEINTNGTGGTLRTLLGQRQAPRLPVIEQPLIDGGMPAAPTVPNYFAPGGDIATDTPSYAGTVLPNGTTGPAPAPFDFSKLFVPAAILLAAAFAGGKG